MSTDAPSVPYLPPISSLETVIGKEIKFSAAHRLCHHRGKCRELHGHTYVLLVEAIGSVLAVDGHSDSGMVFDFGRIGLTLKRLHDRCLDHKDLGNFDPYPTAERLVLRIAYLLQLDLGVELADAGARLHRVRLYEEHTFPACYAEVQAPNIALLRADAFPDTALCRAADWERGLAKDFPAAPGCEAPAGAAA